MVSFKEYRGDGLASFFNLFSGVNHVGKKNKDKGWNIVWPSNHFHTIIMGAIYAVNSRFKYHPFVVERKNHQLTASFPIYKRTEKICYLKGVFMAHFIARPIFFLLILISPALAWNAQSMDAKSVMESSIFHPTINEIQVQDWDYIFIRKTISANGHEAWGIQGIPKTEIKNREGEKKDYSKILVWVRKDNFMVVKAKFWEIQGYRVKHFQAEDIRQVDGVWTPFRLTLATTIKGKMVHSKVLKFPTIQ